MATGVLLSLLGSAAAMSRWGAGAGGGAVSHAFADLPGFAERVGVERFCTGGEGTLTALPEAPGSGTAGAIFAVSGAYIADVAGPLSDPGAGQATATPTPSMRAYSADAIFFDPMNLVRSLGPTSPGWRSTSAALPQQIGFALRQTVDVDRVAFWHTRRSPPASWARDVTLLFTNTAPDSGYRMAGRRTLGQTTAVQTFSFVAVRVRYIRLCFQSRHGDADFVSLGGFALGVLTGTVTTDSRPPDPGAHRNRSTAS
ncbi:MAG: hypothetical protein ACRDJN_13880 [Chloroflexota bacterium]